MSEDNKRNYDISDSELLAAAEEMLKNFKEHKEDFFAFDPEQFNEKFIKDFEDALATAHALDIDAIESEKPITETSDEDVIIEECTTVFEKLAYFVKRAFPDSEQLRNSFGLDEFSTVISSPARLALFMESVAHMIAEYRRQLLEVHCPERLLDRITELAEQLHDEKAAQATAVRLRPDTAAPHADTANGEPCKDMSDTAPKGSRAENSLKKLLRQPSSDEIEGTSGLNGLDLKGGPPSAS